MRISLSKFFSRVALIALLASPFTNGFTSVRAVAHDLPIVQPYQPCTMDCFADFNDRTIIKPTVRAVAKEPVVNPLAFSSSTQSMISSVTTVAQQAFRLPPLTQRIADAFVRSANDVSNGKNRELLTVSLQVTLPETGNAPSPTVQQHAALPATRSSVIGQSNPLRFEGGYVKRLPNEQLVGPGRVINTLRESHRPYDLGVRDWRFQHLSSPTHDFGAVSSGDYVSRNIDRSERAEIEQPDELLAAKVTVGPSPVKMQIAEWLRTVEDWQCMMHAELSDFRTANRLSAAATKSAIRSLDSVNTTGTLWLAQLGSLSDDAGSPETLAFHPQIASPYFKAPIFTVHEYAGHHFLLTEQEAKRWSELQLVASIPDFPAQPLSVEPSQLSVEDSRDNQSAKFVSATNQLKGQCPVIQAVKSGTLGFASSQLRSLGNQLLQLSHQIDSLTGSKVAERSGSANDVR